jgi:hypothetical protein
MFCIVMELAIPFVALGGLYIISNQKKEGFQAVNKYTSPNQSTDKFFKPQEHKSPSFVDLAGRNVGNVQHSPEVMPYFGKTKNIGGSINNPNSDQVLDNMNGNGTFKISKTENAPLFKPDEHIQWANGAPNQSDFYQSRVNPSISMRNVKPFQEEKVGPGLNKGYTTQGSGGFNSGMDSRALWKDKTVDELRVATKPKESYELTGHQGPAQSSVTNLGIQAPVNKHLPDRYYVNTPDRYLTTNGDHLGQTLRQIQPDPTIHRATTTKSYSGIAGNGGVQVHAKQGMYRTDHRQQLKSVPVTPAGTSVPFSNLQTETESYKLLPTNRSVTQPESFGGLGGLVSAITAPITDMLRPTRKEDLVGLTRIGNLGNRVPNAPLPEKQVASTIKETTMFSPLETGSRPYAPVTTGGYHVNEHKTETTNRSDTSISYSGVPGSIMPQQVSYEAQYNATITSNRANPGRIAGGNTQVYAPIINQTTTSNRSTMHASYIGGAQGGNVMMGVDQFNTTRNPNKYAEPERNTPDLLSAFKQNPYTHSLHSAV